MSIRVLSLALMPSMAFAEVSDKIVLPPTMVAYGLVLGLLAVLINRGWPRFFPLIAIVTILLSAQGAAVVLDDLVGPAALAEQGVRYKYIAFGTVAVVAVANIAGAIWGFRARTRSV
jgi:hypothetical protein